GDMVGAEAVLATMERLGAEEARFAPSATLQRLAKNGGRFIDVLPG
ncbi:3-hydroxyacyl-CoA dehydrogenase / enoyl-CoA hydratase / 3-hydroxybutyryl-CoA epimerase / enoyl-CoA isomerase, partial [Hyphomonas hirschiana VP5]